MNQTFHPWCQFNESSESNQTFYNACYDVARVELLASCFPRTRSSRFDAEADFAFIRIHFQHFHAHLIAFGQYIGWLVNMAPCDLGYVNQTVHAANVNECAELREALHRAFQHLSVLKLGHYFLFVCFELFFQNVLLGKNHFVVLAVQLFHFYAKRAAFVVAEVFNEVTLDHGSRNKAACADIGYESAFNHVSHRYFEYVLIRKMLLKLFPGILGVDRAFGKNQAFLVVVDANDLALYLLANLNRIRCIIKLYRRQFANRNYAVIFISNAYVSLVVLQFDDRPFTVSPFSRIRFGPAALGFLQPLDFLFFRHVK
ncbi:Uncharacterised protein [Actinobacillus pleuropneumoniae]|nr:Uncharacterised protein [Actinobacillus pleuropneumoniae]